MSPIPDIPSYDRITTETTADGVKVTYYWSDYWPVPVFTDWSRPTVICSSVNHDKDQQESGHCPVCAARL